MSAEEFRLLLSLAALLVGPLLVALCRHTRATLVALDAFVLVVVGGLVVTHILPASIQMAGVWAGILAVLGFLAPTLVERTLSSHRASVHQTVLVLALVGMFVHTVIDGMALTGHFHYLPSGPTVHREATGDVLAWAVILHRIPVGVAIWWIVPRTLGGHAAALLVAITVVGTCLGWWVGPEVITGTSVHMAGLFQAFLAGSLLHVLFHAHVPAPAPAQPRRLETASVVGAGLAIATVAGILLSHGHERLPGDALSSGEIFLTLALESAPALIIAYLMVGISSVLLPPQWTSKLGGGRPLGQAIKGLLVGLPLPICSCGVLPLYRQLVRKGTVVPAAMAFLIATPELEIAAFLLTWHLIGGEVAAARVAMAAAIALILALVVGSRARTEMAPAETAPPRSEGDDGAGKGSPAPPGRLRRIFAFGFGEAVDSTGPWILLGLGLSALLVPYLDREWLANLPDGIDVPVAALLGLPIYVCASGSTPLAAVLVASGLSPGAALAFLITGPATNITTFGVLKDLHGARIAFAFAGTMILSATLLGLLVNTLLGSTPAVAESLLHDHGGGSTLQWTALALLAAALLGSVLRRGVRPFLEQILGTPTNGHDCH